MYQRKNGSWCDTLPVGNGKYKFFYGKTKSEVKAKMSAWKAEQEKGISLESAADAWYAEKSLQVSAKTALTYSTPLTRLKEHFAGRYCSDIQSAEIQAYLNSLGAKKYHKQTVALYFCILKMIFDYAINQSNSAVHFNPCYSCRLPARLEKNVRQLPSREDVQIIKDNVNEHFGLFPYLLIYTGLRRGEALALTDKDFSESQINVSKSVSFVDGKSVLSRTKTASSVRSVALLKPLKDVLPKWQGYLFSADGGKTPLTWSLFQSYWNMYCIHVGLADKIDGKYKNRICPHQLRHEFATICYDAGLDVKDAADLLGHANESTTREIYTHIQEERRKQSLDKLNSYIESY